jgi:hypothetical protein
MRYHYASKDHFLAIARAGEKEDFNRQVNWELLDDQMDPKGTNICVFTMVHEHKHGYRVDPHLRTRWLLKLRGTMEPAEVFLDMSFDHFNGLPTLEYPTEETA